MVFGRFPIGGTRINLTLSNVNALCRSLSTLAISVHRREESREEKLNAEEGAEEEENKINVVCYFISILLHLR
jgi:hypothetical protein